MVEATGGKRRLPLLWMLNAFKRAHYGSYRSGLPGREKHQRKCGAVLQGMQHRQKTTAADRMGRIPQDGPQKSKQSKIKITNKPEHPDVSWSTVTHIF